MHSFYKLISGALRTLKKPGGSAVFRRVSLLCILLISLWGQSVAQVIFPDSIQSFLHQPQKDSAYIMALNALAFSYLKSHPDIARNLAARAIEHSRDQDFIRGYARALNITGSSYWVTSDYESALDYYQLSARESGAIGDTLALAIAYNNMGEVYKKIGNYKKSIEFLTTSMIWSKKIHRPYAISLYNIGEDHLLMNKLAEAKNYFNQSMNQARVENDQRAIAYTYQGIGMIFQKEGRHSQALGYLAKAEELWKSQHEIRPLIQTYQIFADAYTTLREPIQAKGYITQAMKLADEIHAADLQIINYQKLADILILLNENRLAVDALKKYSAMKDSVYDIKKTEQIARLDALFDAESRDMENQQLKIEQTRKAEQIKVQQLFIMVISFGLLMMGIMIWMLFRQRRKIMDANNLLNARSIEIERQKVEIESQAAKLINLNDQLQNVNRSLEDRIEERTHLLRKQNVKLAEYAHANAHLLRAPIVSILGLLNLIEKIELSEEDKLLIRHLQKCGKDLDRITREISRNLEEEEGII